MLGMSQRHQPPSILHHLFCLSLTTQIQKGKTIMFSSNLYLKFTTPSTTCIKDNGLSMVAWSMNWIFLRMSSFTVL